MSVWLACCAILLSVVFAYGFVCFFLLHILFLLRGCFFDWVQLGLAWFGLDPQRGYYWDLFGRYLPGIHKGPLVGDLPVWEISLGFGKGTSDGRPPCLGDLPGICQGCK